MDYNKEFSYKALHKKFLLKQCATGAVGIFLVFIILAVGGFKYWQTTANYQLMTTITDYEHAIKSGTYVHFTPQDVLYDPAIVADSLLTNSPSEVYLFTEFDGKELFVVFSPEEYQKMLTKIGKLSLQGYLEEIPQYNMALLEETVADDKSSQEGAASALLKYYLKVETPFQIVAPYIIMAVLLLISILIVAYPIAKQNRTALQSLQNFAKGDLELAYKDIDKEIPELVAFKQGAITVTANYIIVKNNHSLFALPLQELIWVYMSQNIFSKYLPIHRTLVLVFSDSTQYKVYATKQVIDDFLEYCTKTITSAFVGYSDKYRSLLKDKPGVLLAQNKEHY